MLRIRDVGWVKCNVTQRNDYIKIYAKFLDFKIFIGLWETRHFLKITDFGKK